MIHLCSGCNSRWRADATRDIHHPSLLVRLEYMTVIKCLPCEFTRTHLIHWKKFVVSCHMFFKYWMIHQAPTFIVSFTSQGILNKALSTFEKFGMKENVWMCDVKCFGHCVKYSIVKKSDLVTVNICMLIDEVQVEMGGYIAIGSTL